jgi:hypothetical protein
LTWATIRDGMKTRLDTISGLTVHDVFPGVLPDKDVAVILPGEPLLEPSGHGSMYDVNIRVVVRVKRTVKDAQALLDDYVWPSGAKSVIAAVQAGSTLGGAVDGVVDVRVSGYGTVEDANTWQAEIQFRARVSTA